MRDYINKKQRNLVKIERMNDDYVITSKRFDELLGTEIDPVEESITVRDLQDREKRMINELKDIQQLIEDVDAIKVVRFRMS